MTNAPISKGQAATTAGGIVRIRILFMLGFGQLVVTPEILGLDFGILNLRHHDRLFKVYNR